MGKKHVLYFAFKKGQSSVGLSTKTASIYFDWKNS